MYYPAEHRHRHGARGAHRRARPRAGAAAAEGGAPARGHRRARRDRGRPRPRAAVHRDREPEADPDRQGRDDGARDRPRRPAAHRGAARAEDLPAAAGEGVAEVAPERDDARAPRACSAMATLASRGQRAGGEALDRSRSSGPLRDDIRVPWASVRYVRVERVAVPGAPRVAASVRGCPALDRARDVVRARAARCSPRSTAASPASSSSSTGRATGSSSSRCADASEVAASLSSDLGL